jgi:hypothetical protein
MDEPYLTNFGEEELDTPDLSLATESVFTAQFQFLIETLLLERTTNSSVSLTVFRSVKKKEKNEREGQKSERKNPNQRKGDERGEYGNMEILNMSRRNEQMKMNLQLVLNETWGMAQLGLGSPAVCVNSSALHTLSTSSTDISVSQETHRFRWSGYEFNLETTTRNKQPEDRRAAFWRVS